MTDDTTDRLLAAFDRKWQPVPCFKCGRTIMRSDPRCVIGGSWYCQGCSYEHDMEPSGQFCIPDRVQRKLDLDV